MSGLLNDSEFSETFINDGRKIFVCLASVLILILSKSGQIANPTLAGSLEQKGGHVE